MQRTRPGLCAWSSSLLMPRSTTVTGALGPRTQCRVARPSDTLRPLPLSAIATASLHTRLAKFIVCFFRLSAIVTTELDREATEECVPVDGERFEHAAVRVAAAHTAHARQADVGRRIQ
ncbi:hypothetical protein PsYK624_173370 [Phanerochaete sordida]|uniref:Uncharacterized protein n=1 Tax=Phanerochaete sordida TaxID=48140 RepID=A0A9P3GSE4_9APHY|nr:hypothetical protein PsYK624_173370 [Phanerochaete sordida]